MSKKVTVRWRSEIGEIKEDVYENIASVIEDKNYEHVTAIRLYDEKGDLRAKIDYGAIVKLDIVDQL